MLLDGSADADGIPAGKGCAPTMTYGRPDGRRELPARTPSTSWPASGVTPHSAGRLRGPPGRGDRRGQDGHSWTQLQRCAAQHRRRRRPPQRAARALAGQGNARRHPGALQRRVDDARLACRQCRAAAYRRAAAKAPKRSRTCCQRSEHGRRGPARNAGGHAGHLPLCGRSAAGERRPACSGMLDGKPMADSQPRSRPSTLGHPLQRQDIDMYLERHRTDAKPISQTVKGTTDDAAV